MKFMDIYVLTFDAAILPSFLAYFFSILTVESGKHMLCVFVTLDICEARVSCD
jgi:hypothetical protein